MSVDYKVLWAACNTVEGFGDRLNSLWASAYLATVPTSPDDLVLVDPGNGFSYLFDLAGSLVGELRAWAPRVVGVWGRSQPASGRRDKARMRGHPRPRRGEDDRGHLISCAAGGGYDINLVPMDAALNRGRSAAGAHFRAMERLAAEAPGSLFFIRPLYEDHSDRPTAFEVGVQQGDGLLVEVFDNPASGSTAIPALAGAIGVPLGADLVAGCLDSDDSRDALFARAWRSGPACLTPRERCAIAGVTGHVAESVVELVLNGVGWHVLWHFTGPGRHGVDLVFLAPGDLVVAVEVKGTLVEGRVPRLSRRELTQMSAAWLDKADNPGMAELGIQSADVYGGVVVVNFADLNWRAALTADFVFLHPVVDIGQLGDLTWLAGYS